MHRSPSDPGLHPALRPARPCIPSPRPPLPLVMLLRRALCATLLATALCCTIVTAARVDYKKHEKVSSNTTPLRARTSAAQRGGTAQHSIIAVHPDERVSSVDRIALVRHWSGRRASSVRGPFSEGAGEADRAPMLLAVSRRCLSPSTMLGYETQLRIARRTNGATHSSSSSMRISPNSPSRAPSPLLCCVLRVCSAALPQSR